jgi:hypothetical protein
MSRLWDMGFRVPQTLAENPFSNSGVSQKFVILSEAKNPAFCFQHLHLLFFRPKTACQAPSSPNPLPANNIRVTYQFHSNRYTGYRSKQTSPGEVQG